MYVDDMTARPRGRTVSARSGGLRSALSALLAAAVALALAACGNGPSSTATPDGVSTDPPDIAVAKDEGRVIWYTTTGSDLGLQEALRTAFRDQYGITLDIFQAPAATLLERYYADVQRGESPDILLADDAVVRELGEQGAYASYTPASVDSDYTDERRTNSPYTYASSIVTYGVAWNTDAVGDDDPAQFDTFDKVLDPRWTGKIGMPDPNLVGGAFGAMWAKRQSMGPEKWLEFEQLLGALQPVMFANNPQTVAALTSNQISVAWIYDALIDHQLEAGAPLAYAYPEGTPASFAQVGVLATARNPNAAKLFLDWFTSATGQGVWSQNAGDLPGNPKVEVKRHFDDQAWYEPPADGTLVFAATPPTADEKAAFLAEFNSVVLGK